MIGKTKRMYIEITTLDEISYDRIYKILKTNIPKSFIKMFKAEELMKMDVS